MYSMRTQVKRENRQNTTRHIIAQKLEILPELTSKVQNLLVNMHVKLGAILSFLTIQYGQTISQ